MSRGSGTYPYSPCSRAQGYFHIGSELSSPLHFPRWPETAGGLQMACSPGAPCTVPAPDRRQGALPARNRLRSAAGLTLRERGHPAKPDRVGLLQAPAHLLEKETGRMRERRGTRDVLPRQLQGPTRRGTRAVLGRRRPSRAGPPEKAGAPVLQLQGARTPPTTRMSLAWALLQRPREGRGLADTLMSPASLCGLDFCPPGGGQAPTFVWPLVRQCGNLPDQLR